MHARRLGAIAVVALLAVGLVGAAGAASAAPRATSTLTVFFKQTQRDVLDTGTTGPTVGDVVTGSGVLTSTKGGKSIGRFAYRSETIRVNIPGGLENRNSTLWYTLPGGTIGATSLISVPSGARPVKSQEYVVIGGTGKYAGVRGTMTFTPLSADDYKSVFSFIN